MTYDAAFTGRTALDETFAQAGLETNVVLTAIDTDVIKTYVRQGMGIGIIAGVAFDAERDFDLVALDGSKLFPERVTKLAWRKGAYLRGYVKDFHRHSVATTQATLSTFHQAHSIMSTIESFIGNTPLVTFATHPRT